MASKYRLCKQLLCVVLIDDKSCDIMIIGESIMHLIILLVPTRNCLLWYCPK